VGYAKSLEQ